KRRKTDVHDGRRCAHNGGGWVYGTLGRIGKNIELRKNLVRSNAAAEWVIDRSFGYAAVTHILRSKISRGEIGRQNWGGRVVRFNPAANEDAASHVQETRTRAGVPYERLTRNAIRGVGNYRQTVGLLRQLTVVLNEAAAQIRRGKDQARVV